MPPAELDPIENLTHLLRACAPAVALTGAGISTESGIPDFRSPGGLYESVDPMEYLSVQALERHPDRFWRMFADVFGPIATYEPNDGHRALAKLEEAGLLRAVVTQNIDGLHQKAGSRAVIEIHGHLRTARCTHCAEKMTLDAAIAQLETRNIPLCPRCTAIVRPDVILFGDPLDAFDQAVALVEASELLIVVGSSLAVSPANSLVGRTPHLAILNREPTPMDATADILIRGSAGKALQNLIERFFA